MTLAIEATALAKTYPGPRGSTPVEALRGVDLSVPAGIVYGLLGPNGAGKSTMTKILTTLSTPTSGTASVQGHDVAAAPAAVRAAIGYVSQGTGADPLLTCTENLVLAARLRGLSGRTAKARTADLLGDLGLADVAGRKAGTLSGGYRRRLDVAIGLVHQPQMLFLDEPTTGLDPEARADMWAQVRRLSAAGGMTVVLTTHYLDEADELSDRIGILDRGRMVIEGTGDELKGTLKGDSITVELVEPDAECVRAAAQRVPILNDVTVEARGTQGRLIARVPDAASAIGPVIAALESAGIAFGAVSASRPSLDDVYLHYAGRSYSAAGDQPAEPPTSAGQPGADPATETSDDPADAGAKGRASR